MTAFTDYLETQIAEWSFAGQNMPAPPSSVYFALHTGDPSNVGNQNEVSAGGYSRAEVQVPADWNVISGTVLLDADIAFPTATEDWGTITHVSIWDGPDASDNALYQISLDTQKTVNNGDVLRFASGNLNVTVD